MGECRGNTTETTTLVEGVTLRTTDTVVTHADVTVDAAADGDVRVMLGVTILVGCPMPQCLGNLPSLLTQLLPKGCAVALFVRRPSASQRNRASLLVLAYVVYVQFSLSSAHSLSRMGVLLGWVVRMQNGATPGQASQAA